LLDPEFTAMPEEKREETIRQIFEQRQKTLYEQLVQRMDPFISGYKKHKQFKQAVKEDINQKLQVPGGASLLYTVGYVYNQEAVKAMGRFLGIESAVENIRETAHTLKGALGLTLAAVEMQTEIEQLQREFQMQSQTMTVDELQRANEELQHKVMAKGLNTMWRFGQLEIESIVREVAKKYLTETQQTKKQLKKRAQALKLCGKMFKKEGQKGKKTEKDPLAFNIEEADTNHFKNDTSSPRNPENDKTPRTTTPPSSGSPTKTESAPTKGDGDSDALDGLD